MCFHPAAGNGIVVQAILIDGDDDGGDDDYLNYYGVVIRADYSGDKGIQGSS